MPRNQNTPIRYGVVGLGWIAQAAMLPAFKHAKKNSQLTALISGDKKKLSALGKKYKVANLYTYEQFDECLGAGVIDALYIALPNHLHAEYAIRATKAGIHVLCEKPMAITESECHSMKAAAKNNKVRLMIAYRLHFEKANLKALELIQKGKIGEPRIFQSQFTMQVKPENYRLEIEAGGGPLRDLGIYCINAARNLYQSEPLSVSTVTYFKGKRFSEVEEMASVILEFPKQRTASFSCSFGSHDTADFTVIGTDGVITLEKAYELFGNKTLTLETKKGKQTFKFSGGDQFAPELLHFSDCIQKQIDPEPAADEGIADVRVLEACFEAAVGGVKTHLDPWKKKRVPKLNQAVFRPPTKKQPLVHAASPTGS